MDDAERWLIENDPEYVETSRDWKQLKGGYKGKYRWPSQEIPAGDDHDLALQAQPGQGRYVESPGWKVCARRSCSAGFQARTPWHLFCTVGCQNAERQRRWRERNAIPLLGDGQSAPGESLPGVASVDLLGAADGQQHSERAQQPVAAPARLRHLTPTGGLTDAY